MARHTVLGGRVWTTPARRGGGDRADAIKIGFAVVALVAAFGLIAWNLGWLSFLEPKPEYVEPTAEEIEQIEEQDAELKRLEDRGVVIEGGA